MRAFSSKTETSYSFDFHWHFRSRFKTTALTLCLNFIFDSTFNFGGRNEATGKKPTCIELDGHILCRRSSSEWATKARAKTVCYCLRNSFHFVCFISCNIVNQTSTDQSGTVLFCVVAIHGDCACNVVIYYNLLLWLTHLNGVWRIDRNLRKMWANQVLFSRPKTKTILILFLKIQTNV